MYHRYQPMMDNVFRWNVRGVLRNMHEAQVISLFFPYLGRALIVDLRCDEAEGPFITTAGLVSGPEERLEHLRTLRPRFELPKNIALAPWLGPVRSLDTSGALADMAARLERIGHPEARSSLDGAYRELVQLERGEILALIRGDVERTRTLFQR
jgi:hypothetical protein